MEKLNYTGGVVRHLFSARNRQPFSLSVYLSAFFILSACKLIVRVPQVQTEYAKPRAVGSLSAHAVGEFAGHECRQATSYTEVGTYFGTYFGNQPFFTHTYISVSRLTHGNDKSNAFNGNLEFFRNTNSPGVSG